MKATHAKPTEIPSFPAACQAVARPGGGYAKFISAEKAKCDIMLSILEFLLTFESLIQRDTAGKRTRIQAEISAARQKLLD